MKPRTVLEKLYSLTLTTVLKRDLLCVSKYTENLQKTMAFKFLTKKKKIYKFRVLKSLFLKFL